ncbi:ribonuclease H-like domain-containing protein [Chaetomidium leptoderma]|uniref:Ribonuclease H-like domain-containing protein n=1 Tax=Chaetomidium leptoderma TaxID=669021 RepID=A0AAN6VCX3_9PEZI|nr:ribonuclease H-like domain-containing protein [Chaetomidium leptoderma]
MSGQARPGYGTLGRPANLWANYVELNPNGSLLLYRYAVDITRIRGESTDPPSGRGHQTESSDQARQPAGMKRAHIINHLFDVYEELRTGCQDRTLASDYRDIVVSTKPLENLMYHVEYCGVKSDYNSEKYKVVLKEPENSQNPLRMSDLLDYLQSTSLSQAPTIQKGVFAQVLNIWLRQFSKFNRLGEPASQTVVGSKTYPLVTGRNNFAITQALGFGVYSIRGYFSSIRFGAAKVWVNINVTHGTFFEPIPLPTWIGAGLRVRLTHRTAEVDGKQKDIVKVISGLASIPTDGVPEIGQKAPDHPPSFAPGAPQYGAQCAQIEFHGRAKGGYVTVYDHFRQAYPQSSVGREDLVVNLGNRLRPAYYPVSVCHIVEGQNYRLKLSDKQTQAMIQFGLLSPERSVGCITKDGFERIGIRAAKGSTPPQHARLLNPAAGLALTEARILAGPSVQYLNVQVGQRPGKWNLRNVGRYNASGQRAVWALLPLGDSSRDGNRRADGLVARFTQLRNQGYNLLFVLLPRKNTHDYSLIKTAADIKVGIQTVCMVEPTIVSKCNLAPRSTRPFWFDSERFDNILLKANLKQGGVNHTLKFSTSEILSKWRAMVLGLDVTHPPPGAADTSPSIIGMVANVDGHLAQWPATICFQNRKNEEIVTNRASFEQLLGPHLDRYAKASTLKKYPDVVIVYRDGYAQIRAVCERVKSIIVVGKRHHTRFYPREQANADPNGNTLPGTVVDRSITSHFLWEFYLQAHEAIQGTARPAHYVVVVDEFFRATFGLQKNMPLPARQRQQRFARFRIGSGGRLPKPSTACLFGMSGLDSPGFVLELIEQ